MAFEAISETYRQEIEKVYNFLFGIYALEYYNRNKDKGGSKLEYSYM